MVYQHKKENDRLRRIYYGVKSRCSLKWAIPHPRYAGRGIKNEWQTFEQFLKDMGRKYKDHVKKFGEKNTTIDRIDNDGNYCKENCRWVSMEQQNENRASNHPITYQGKTMLLKHWAKLLKIKEKKLYTRIFFSKMSLEKAFQTVSYSGRPKTRKFKLCYCGQSFLPAHHTAEFCSRLCASKKIERLKNLLP